MFFYEGQSCPVCGNAFTAQDDVVSCPQCGLPHHRSCWQTEGHCHLSHLHGTDEQWSRGKVPPVAKKDTTPSHVCPRCGTANPEFAEFCSHCGQPLIDPKPTEPLHPPKGAYGEFSPFSPPFQAQAYSSSEILEECNAAELAAVVGTRQEYYLPKFRQMCNGRKAGWNWAAFLFGPLWMFYRKMTVGGVVLMALNLLQSVVLALAVTSLGLQTETDIINFLSFTPTGGPELYYFLSIEILSFIVLLARIVVAVFGNRLYFDHCQSVIRKNKEIIPDVTPPELASKGGTSLTFALIAAGAFYLLSQAVIMLIEFVV